MKSFFAILLAATFLFQSAGKLIVVVKHSLNKEFISKVLCENKAKPILKCNGKCHLRKQLQKEDKKENCPTNNTKEKVEFNYFSENKFEQSTLFSKQKNKIQIHYLSNYYSAHLSKIFQPPRAV